MPAQSQAQQALMALALHSPSKVSKKNKGVLKMKKSQLDAFASTKKKGLPKHKNTVKAIVEGDTAPVFSMAKNLGKGGK